MSPIATRSFELAALSVPPKISDFSLFQEMSAEETGQLEKFCVPRIFNPGEPLFEEGQPMTDIFLIQRGCVKFYKTSPHKLPTVFSIFGEGDVFELLTSGEKEIHLFSTSALTETAALSVSYQNFYRHFMSNPRFARRLLHQKIRTIKQFYFSQMVSSEPVETRMAYFLVTLAQHPGMTRPEGKKQIFDMPLTRRDIAQIVNTSVETCIRVIRKWIKRGLVTMTHRHLTIQDVAAFKKIAAKLPRLPN